MVSPEVLEVNKKVRKYENFNNATPGVWQEVLFCSTAVMSAFFFLFLNIVNALNIKHCLSISGCVFLLNELILMFNLHLCSNHNENIICHICYGIMSFYQEQLTRRIQMYKSIRNSPTRETSLLKQFALQKFPSPWHKEVSQSFLAGSIFKILGTWYTGGSLVSHDVSVRFPCPSSSESI